MKAKSITSFEDLKALGNGIKVHLVIGGHVKGFVTVGTIPHSSGIVVANDASHKDLYSIYKQDFDYKIARGALYTTEYNSKRFGRIMIKQIKSDAKKEIEAITATYLK